MHAKGSRPIPAVSSHLSVMGRAGATAARIGTPLLMASLALPAGIAQADVFVPTNTLGQSGGSALQQRTGQAVQAVCGQFIQAGGVDDTAANAAFQADLFDKCGEMVNTANRLAGNDGSTNKDLGITEEALQSALQNIAGEEIAAAGSISTEMSAQHTANVTKRISTLVGGASGLQLSAVNLYGIDALYAVNENALSPSLSPLSGGNAGEEDGTGLSFFVNGIVGTASKSSTNGEDGFDSDSAGITAGLDFGLSASTVVGVAAGFSSSTADFTETNSVAGGELDVSSAEVSLYGLWFGENAYADAIVTFGAGSYDLERRIVITAAPDQFAESDGSPNDGADRTATAETDSSQVGISLGAGLEIVNGPFTFAPYTRLSYLAVDIDGYEESGAQGLNLAVESQDIESLTSAFGFRFVGLTSTGSGVISPQLSLEMVHEFSDDDREIVSRYVHDPRNNTLVAVTDDPDRDYLVAGVGISTLNQSGLQLYADVKSLFDLDDVNETIYTLGARMAF